MATSQSIAVMKCRKNNPEKYKKMQAEYRKKHNAIKRAEKILSDNFIHFEKIDRIHNESLKEKSNILIRRK